MIDVIERLQKAETRPLDADGKTQLWETLQDARAEIARLRDALDEQTGRAAWHYECLIQRDAQIARLRLTDAEREAIQWAAGQARLFPEFAPICGHAAALRGLHERLGGGR